MKINSDNGIISIRGMYTYNKNSMYENNDFVVKDSLIYVCTTTDDYVKGEDPENSDNFKPYLYDKIISVDDYLELADEGIFDENKLITANSLKAILNHYMKGLNSSGEITSSINISGNELSTDIEELVGNSNDVLFRLMIGNINNGIFKVSRDLPEISNIIPTNDSDEPCILRQFTYSNNNITYRIQELIDHLTGIICYRSCSLEDTEEPDWLYASISNGEVQNLLNNNQKLISNKLKALSSLSEDLMNNFRYRDITYPISSSSSTIVLNKNTAPKLISSFDLDTDTGLMLNITLFNNSESIIKQKTIMINAFNNYSYYIDDSTTLKVSWDPNNITIKLILPEDSSYKIVNIQYKDYFKGL